MPYSASENEIRDLFTAYGPVGEVRIIGDKGFGFVEVPEENMQSAIDGTHGTQFGGRTLTVNEARPRTDRGPRRDSGRSGGGYGGGGRRW